MTKIALLFFKDGAPKGFSVKGHSGYSESGSDIVCAAVSSASYLVANTLIEVMKLDVSPVVSDGLMKITVKEKDKERARDILKGYEIHTRELAEQYPDYVMITTEV